MTTKQFIEKAIEGGWTCYDLIDGEKTEVEFINFRNYALLESVPDIMTGKPLPKKKWWKIERELEQILLDPKIGRAHV